MIFNRVAMGLQSHEMLSEVVQNFHLRWSWKSHEILFYTKFNPQINFFLISKKKKKIEKMEKSATPSRDGSNNGPADHRNFLRAGIESMPAC